MTTSRKILFALGMVIALIGAVWTLQGAGIFRYPAESFMIDQTSWIWRGAVVCVGGLALALLPRRG